MTPPTMLKRTPLHQAHRDLGAKMVPFAGWEMPVHYTGIVDEHKAVPQAAGAFDVSHMGEGTEPVGRVTSGTTAPSLGVAVGMGYVPTPLAEPGTQPVVDCRGKPAPVEVVKGPFYKRSQG